MIKSSKESKTVPSEQKILIDQIAKFQAKLENVDTFDSVILPPLYRQVVRFALWSYFLLALIGSQAKQDEPYIFLPLFLILRFIFYVGWLEVAEAIENPFGNTRTTSTSVSLSQGISGPSAGTSVSTR